MDVEHQPGHFGKAPQRARGDPPGVQLVDLAGVEESDFVELVGHVAIVARQRAGTDQSPRCRRSRRAMPARAASANAPPNANPVRCADHATAPKAGPMNVNTNCSRAQMPISRGAGTRTNCRNRPSGTTTPSRAPGN